MMAATTTRHITFGNGGDASIAGQQPKAVCVSLVLAADLKPSLSGCGRGGAQFDTRAA